ncbi:MAG TPA: hypothetical protein VE967_18905 [Gemmatimonadaceae bacterium]|nr:hypothetical protein [Gemmatimonadaceae bacterium]
MTHDPRADRIREDRTVEFLRTHGFFAGAVQSSRKERRAARWRIPLIAAAAAIVIAAVSIVADRTARQSQSHVAQPAAPKLIIWY